MVSLLIGLLVICLVIYIAWWALSQIPLPQPVRIVINVLLAIVLIYVVLSYAPLPVRPLRL